MAIKFNIKNKTLKEKMLKNAEKFHSEYNVFSLLAMSLFDELSEAELIKYLFGNSSFVTQMNIQSRYREIERDIRVTDISFVKDIRKLCDIIIKKNEI